MIIDYDAWKEGTPYDIPALADVTPEERDRLTDEICERSSLDWRDVEALRALATPKAIKRVGVAAEKQTDGGGIEAFADEIEKHGWTEEIATAHPTPAVMKQLMRGARISGDNTVRYSMGGFLLELTGHVDTRYTFDKDIRPHLLDLNSDDYKTYKAAVAWLEDKVANPKKR